MPPNETSGTRDVRASCRSSVAAAVDAAFVPLSDDDIRNAFAVPAVVPPILSLSEAAELVKLRPQTLKRKVAKPRRRTLQMDGHGTTALLAADAHPRCPAHCPAER